MRLDEITETPEGLYRKILALDAMINDRATTQGEKDNARAAKERLEKKLKSKFPNFNPTNVDVSQDELQDIQNSFWANMTRGAKVWADREEQWKKDPEERKRFYKDRLEKLKKKRKELSRYRGMGDVELEQQYQEISSEIERIMRREFPEEYKELMQKRDEKNRKADAKRYKEQMKKAAEVKKAVKDSGKQTFKQATKENKELLKRAYKIFTKNNAEMRFDRRTTSLSGGIDSFLYWLPHVKGLRSLWSKLDPADQEKIKEVVDSINELGSKGNGYTPAQKKKVLDQMRPSKAPPRRPFGWSPSARRRRSS